MSLPRYPTLNSGRTVDYLALSLCKNEERLQLRLLDCYPDRGTLELGLRLFVIRTSIDEGY